MQAASTTSGSRCLQQQQRCGAAPSRIQRALQPAAPQVQHLPASVSGSSVSGSNRCRCSRVLRAAGSSSGPTADSRAQSSALSSAGPSSSAAAAAAATAPRPAARPAPALQQPLTMDSLARAAAPGEVGS